MPSLQSFFNLVFALVMSFTWLVNVQPAEARFAIPRLEQVPVERLIENLTAKVEASPKDVKLRRNLARAHAMAYANKGDQVQVGGFGKNQDGLWFGPTPKYVPFKVQPRKGKEEMPAQEQLSKAIDQYREAIKLAPDDLATRLGLAWALHQAGEADEARPMYRKIIEDAWEKEGDQRFGRLGGNYITVEAGGYLTELLDAKADADEIAELKQRAAKLKKLPRPVTPIAVPLRAGLTEQDIHDRDASVTFDADGTGLPHKWTWLNDNAGWLVYDAEGHGRIDSAIQLFGSATFMMFWDNGYQALASLDDNHDGALTGDELNHLAIWHDANRNGVSDSGEVRPVQAYGIRELGCGWQADEGGVLFSPRGAVFDDDTVRRTFDIILQPRG